MAAVADMSATGDNEWQDYEYLTASNLNSFFHFGCQLELWKSFHEGHRPGLQEPPPPISRAHISRGHQWEKRLVHRLNAQNLILKISKRTSFQAQVEGDPRDHFYVVNSEFKDRNIFRNEFLARKTAPVTFGSFKPDFIEVWKRLEEGRLVIEYHVIDAKASYALHVRFSLIVLITDCTSSPSVLLLACSAGSASSRNLCSFNNGFHLVVKRGPTYPILARGSEASNGFASVFDASASRTSPTPGSSLALQFSMRDMYVEFDMSTTN